MPVYQAGSLNTAALTAPDLYVQVIAPKTRLINGVATDILGIVGVASWGPTNSPFLIGSTTDMQRLVGGQQVRKYDLATAVAVSLQLGAANIRAVRICAWKMPEIRRATKPFRSNSSSPPAAARKWADPFGVAAGHRGRVRRRPATPT